MTKRSAAMWSDRGGKWPFCGTGMMALFRSFLLVEGHSSPRAGVKRRLQLAAILDLADWSEHRSVDDFKWLSRQSHFAKVGLSDQRGENFRFVFPPTFRSHVPALQNTAEVPGIAGQERAKPFRECAGGLLSFRII